MEENFTYMNYEWHKKIKYDTDVVNYHLFMSKYHRYRLFKLKVGTIKHLTLTFFANTIYNYET